jgi:hypothetical protein
VPRCDHKLPHVHSGIIDYKLPLCRLEDGHDGEHEVLLPDGRVMWFEYDHECGCDTDDFCGCYLYRFANLEPV